MKVDRWFCPGCARRRYCWILWAAESSQTSEDVWVSNAVLLQISVTKCLDSLHLVENSSLPLCYTRLVVTTTVPSDVAVIAIYTRPGSDLTFWNSTHLKLFQLTLQLSWNIFFQLISKFCDSLFDLGVNGKIVLSHSKRKQVHAIAIMTPSITT